MALSSSVLHVCVYVYVYMYIVIPQLATFKIWTFIHTNIPARYELSTYEQILNSWPFLAMKTYIENMHCGAGLRNISTYKWRSRSEHIRKLRTYCICVYFSMNLGAKSKCLYHDFPSCNYWAEKMCMSWEEMEIKWKEKVIVICPMMGEVAGGGGWEQ